MNEQVQHITNLLRKGGSILLQGQSKTIAGMARFATLNSPDCEYIKVSFTDGSGMYYPLEENTLFVFDKKLTNIADIEVSGIGIEEKISLSGVEYVLVNGNDYQFVKEFYIGTILDLEGEVRFSDYEDADGNVLSFGITVVDGKRADVPARKCSTEIIEFTHK